jgi:hypothetical protein
MGKGITGAIGARALGSGLMPARALAAAAAPARVAKKERRFICLNGFGQRACFAQTLDPIGGAVKRDSVATVPLIEKARVVGLQFNGFFEGDAKDLQFVHFGGICRASWMARGDAKVFPIVTDEMDLMLAELANGFFADGGHFQRSVDPTAVEPGASRWSAGVRLVTGW